MNNLVGGFVAVLVGVSLLPEVSGLVQWRMEENIETKTHKQTYIEYVRERLEVERLLR